MHDLYQTDGIKKYLINFRPGDYVFLGVHSEVFPLLVSVCLYVRGGLPG